MPPLNSSRTETPRKRFGLLLLLQLLQLLTAATGAGTTTAAAASTTNATTATAAAATTTTTISTTMDLLLIQYWPGLLPVIDRGKRRIFSTVGNRQWIMAFPVNETYIFTDCGDFKSTAIF